MSYTKGPWAINGNKMIIYQDIKESQLPIAVVSTGTIYGAYDSDEYCANAHLIAAAPELLEACKEFVRKVDCGEARSKRSYKQMKEAIAKAEGVSDE